MSGRGCDDVADLAGKRLQVEPSSTNPDVHMLPRSAMACMGTAFVPDAGVSEAGSPEDRFVPVLPDEVGRNRALHIGRGGDSADSSGRRRAGG